jgi:hypothetical protein
MKKIFISLVLLAVLFSSFVFAGSTGIVSEVNGNSVVTAIVVQEGWNLVPVSVSSGAGFSIHRPTEFQGEPFDQDNIIGPENAKYVWIYDIEKNKYVGGDPSLGANDGLREFTDRVAESEGFSKYYDHVAAWYYFDKEGVLFLEKTTDRFPKLEDYELIPGWNFAHLVPDMDGKNITEFQGDCNIERTAVWDPFDQNWMVSNKGDENFGFTVRDNGFALPILLKVSDRCTFAGSSVAPPAIPQ